MVVYITTYWLFPTLQGMRGIFETFLFITSYIMLFNFAAKGSKLIDALAAAAGAKRLENCQRTYIYPAAVREG